MEPELKALVDKALAEGASKEAIRVIMMDYYGLKKKDSTSELGSVEEADSSEYTSLPSMATRKEAGVSDLPTVEPLTEYRFNGRNISESDAQLIGQYADEHELAYKKYIEEHFSLDTYYSYSPSRLSALAEYSEADREETKKDLIENILSSGGMYEAEVQSELLLGIDSEYSAKVSSAAQTAQSLEGSSSILSGPALGLLPGNDPAERQKKAREQLVGKYSSSARTKLNNQLSVDTSARVRSLLTEEQQSDPEELRRLERHMYAQYQIPLDLDGTGYVNDKEGRVHALADSWDSFIASSYELGSIVKIASEDAIGKVLGDTAAGEVVRNLSNWHRLEQQMVSRNLREDVRIPLQSISEKVESGDVSGALADGLVMTGDSMPMMLAAIATGAITKSPTATASVVSLVGGATTYNSVRDEEWFDELSTVKQAAYISVNGIAEGLPALVGANIFNRFRKIAIASAAGKQSARDLVKGFLLATPLGMVEEGVTEGVTAGVQYLTNIAAQDKEFSSQDFNRSVKDGWWGGVIMAGTLGGAGMAAGGGLRGAQLAFTSAGALRNKIEIKKLEKEFSKEKTTSGRAIIGQKLSEAIQGGARLEKKRRAFYEFLEEASPEAYSQIVTLQKQISKLSVQHSRVGSKLEQKNIAAQVQALVSKRSEIEGQYESEFDLNANTETKRILKAVAGIDKNYLQYGELFEEGSDSTEVTGENVDSVSDAIEKAGMKGLQLKLPLGIGKITSPEAVKKGLQNAMAVVKALSKQRGFKKMVIHRTLASMQNATNTSGASGMWYGNGEIHLLAPALHENTAYHEGYHEFVVQELGEDAARQLAKRLEKGLSGELREKYKGFLSDYVARAGKKFFSLAEALGDPNFEFADEFLIELLADITNKDVGIEYKRGVLRQFTDFVASGLGKIGVSGLAPAKLDDLVRAIETVTGQVREGQAPAAIADVWQAAERLGYMNMSGSLMDEDDGDDSKPLARLKDVEEVTSAKTFADAMTAAVDEQAAQGNKIFLQVTKLTEEAVQEILDGGGKLFMTKDGMSGAYTRGDGYMGGLFKNPNSSLKFVSAPLQLARIAAGGTFFDAFATRLESLYVDNGFKPVARLDFNPEFAPEGWNDVDSPLRTQPDVVFFVRGEGQVGEGTRLTAYEDAYNMASNSSGKAQNPLITDVAKEAFAKASGITEAQLEQRKQELKLDETQREKRNPRIVKTLEEYKDEEITQEQLISMVREEMPIRALDTVPNIPTFLDIASSLTERQVNRGLVGLTKEIPEGHYVGSRLDISAYNNYNVWVVSAHEGKKGEERKEDLNGKAIGYAQTALLSGVTFKSYPNVAFNIAREKGKVTIARIFGDWSQHTPAELREQAEEIMAGNEYNKEHLEEGIQEGWIQVGMNPFRHSWFYDKRDGRPVVAASKVIQIGALVLAKDTEKVSYEDQRFEFYTKEGNRIRFQNPLGSVEGEGFVGPRPRSEFVTSVRGGTEQGERVGQGFAASKKNKVEVVKPESNDGTIDISIKGLRKANEKLYIKNAKFLSELDIVRAERKFRGSVFEGPNALKFSDEVYDIFKQEAKNNLLWLHDQFDPVLREVSTLWYDGANIISHELAEKFNIPASNVSAIIAALSPQKDWFQNLRLAELVLEVVVQNSSEVVSEDMIEYLDSIDKPKWAEQLRTHRGKSIGELQGASAAIAVWAYADVNLSKEYPVVSPDGVRGGNATNADGSNKVAAWGSTGMIQKAISAVTATSMEELSKLLGTKHKIRNFFNNINAPSNGSDATIDTHAVAAAHLKPFSGSNAEVEINFGGSKAFINRDGELFSLKQMKEISGLEVPTKVGAWAEKKGYRVVNSGGSQVVGYAGTYFAYLDAYREAAAERGLLPREMQSITWEAVRLLYTEGFKTTRNKSDIEALHRQYTNKEITKDKLRNELLKKADGIGIPSWEPIIRPKLQRISRQAPYGGNVFGGSDSVGAEGTGAGRGAGGTGILSGKSQGDLTRLIANFLDNKYPNPKVTVDKRKKNPISISEGSQASLFITKKKEVLEMLIGYGLGAEAAEAVYRNAKAYKEGRIVGKKEAMRVARKAFSEGSKLSTQAQNLRKELELIRDKAKTVNEFVNQAIELIKERMAETSQIPFSKGQIIRLVKLIRAAHKTSAKKIEAEGMDAMQTFIDRISTIFDSQDAKLELNLYLKGVAAAKKMQARLSRMSSARGKGEALKGTATYNPFAKRLANIRVELLPRTELAHFLNVMAGTIDSMSKAKAVWNADLEGFEGVSPVKIEAVVLANLVSNFQAMEELGRNAMMVASARRRAQKNNTSFDEEFAKLTKAYERSRLTASRKAILNFIDDFNSKNNERQLDSANPADVEFVLDSLADIIAETQQLKKEAIINDVLIPRVAANMEKLLEDRQISEILGFFNEGDFNADALRKRLEKLSTREVVNLDYKLEDFILNDSVFGLGYFHSMVRGKLDYNTGLSRLIEKKKLKSRAKNYLAMLDTVDSFMRNLIPTDNITFSKLRIFTGFAEIEKQFAKADFIHASLVEKIEAEVNRIQADGGSLSSIKDRAIMQLFSMARQMPSLEGKKADVEAIWYNDLKNAMRRTIDFNSRQGSLYSSEDIVQFEAAYEFLFGGTSNLQGLLSKVQKERSDAVELVDFIATMHTGLMPAFSSYVERYLGKELVMEENYTPFDVRIKKGNEDVESFLKLRKGMLEALQSTSLSQTKKVAGSSFERNKRSISGANNMIGMDFLGINERTIRENVILSNTVGSVVTARFVMGGDVMEGLIPNESSRKTLERKMMMYIQQDTGKVPAIFQSDFVLFGQRVINPLNLLRQAVVVKAFGGLIVQTLKQSTVLVSVVFQTRNPLQAVPYLTQTVAEMVYYSGKTGLRKDSKISLDANGRYKLLQNSPVFSRDYEAGNIDPYTGRMSLDETGFQKFVKSANDVALKNLKGTDKVAAIASWFTFYGDAMITEGVVGSYSEIDWEQEAISPNATALSYADTMVTKDQAASTPRQAADIYQDDKGGKAAISYLVRNVVLPFSRFAVNKKRSVMSDILKLGKKDTFARAAVALGGHVTELSLFASISNILIPAIATAFIGDDEEISKEENGKRWYSVLGQVIVDFNPLPPLGPIDDAIRGLVNKFLIFPLTAGSEYRISEKDTYDDMYERWKNVEGGIPIYGATDVPPDDMKYLFKFAGPYGDFVLDAANTLENITLPGNKVITKSGREYYVRPEDKSNMDMHFMLKTLLLSTQMVGFSVKELDIVARNLDNLGSERRLSSEAALAAYEEVLIKVAKEGGSDAMKAIESFEDGAGRERLLKLIAEFESEPMEQERIANKFSSSITVPAAETYLKKKYPGSYSKYIRDARNSTRSLGTAKDYYLLMKSRAESMAPEEFEQFKQIIDGYISITMPGRFEERMFLEATAE